jgi:hypothetical protein
MHSSTINEEIEMNSLYKYMKTDNNLWIVGFYTANKEFFATELFQSEDEAIERVDYINNAKMVSYNPGLI